MLCKIFLLNWKGSGAFANNKKINVSNNNKIGLGVLATGFPYNVADNPNNAFERFESLTKQARAVRRLGSAAIDFVMLLAEFWWFLGSCTSSVGFMCR